MTKLNTIPIGTKVKHRWSDRTGVVIETEEGCNALIKVDFNTEFNNWFVPSDLEVLPDD